MSEAQEIKNQCINMAAEELQLLLHIIGELSYPGYRICMCKLKGYSYQQCANRYGVTKEQARYFWAKCQENKFDTSLKTIFKI